MVQDVMLNKKGFTIIETLVAMIIFSLVLIFMLQGFLLAYRLNYEKLVKDETVKIAQEELERLRSISYADINSTCSDTCNNFDPASANKDCLIQRQIRNNTVVFGREISVDEDYPYKQVTVVICSPHTDFQGKPIIYRTTTVISDKGY